MIFAKSKIKNQKIGGWPPGPFRLPYLIQLPRTCNRKVPYPNLLANQYNFAARLGLGLWLLVSQHTTQFPPSIHGSLQISIQQSPRNNPFSWLIDGLRMWQASIYPPTWIWDCAPDVVVQTKTGARLPDRKPPLSSSAKFMTNLDAFIPQKCQEGRLQRWNIQSTFARL